MQKRLSVDNNRRIGILLHDSHVAKNVKQTLLQWKVLPHPAFKHDTGLPSLLRGLQ